MMPWRRRQQRAAQRWRARRIRAMAGVVLVVGVSMLLAACVPGPDVVMMAEAAPSWFDWFMQWHKKDSADNPGGKGTENGDSGRVRGTPPEWVDTWAPDVQGSHCAPSVVAIRGMQKSGTTWLEMQLVSLANESAHEFRRDGALAEGKVRPNGLHVQTAASNRADRCRFTVFERGPHAGQNKHRMDVRQSGDTCEDQLFRSHNPCLAASDPGGAREWASTRRGGKFGCLPRCAKPATHVNEQLFIPIFRDARDVVISAYYFWTATPSTSTPVTKSKKQLITFPYKRASTTTVRGPAKNTLGSDSQVPSAAGSGNSLGSRIKRAAMWHWFYVESGLVQHVLPVYYEDMRINQRAVLRRIAERLNIRVNDAVLDRVVRETSFDRMRELEDQNQLVGLSRPGKGTRRKVRCGGVGQWSAWPAERQKEAEDQMREHMTGAMIERYLPSPEQQAMLQRQIDMSKQALCE